MKRKSLFFLVFKRTAVAIKKAEKEEDVKTVKRLMEKYKHLRKRDQLQLIENHLVELERKSVNEIYDFVREKKRQKEIEDEYEQKKKMKLWKLRKPAYLQQKNIKRKTTEALGINEYDDKSCLEKEKELEEAEKYTLIEDLYKSFVYGKSFQLLYDQYSTCDKISNDFIYVMINTIRQNILEKIKPTLINEFSVYKNPFMLFKNALFNFILYKFVKNPYEETLIENYLQRNIQLNMLKINSASVPPEVFEPLVAFRGDILYNSDLKKRFSESINTSLKIIHVLKEQQEKQEQQEQQEQQQKQEQYKTDEEYKQEKQLQRKKQKQPSKQKEKKKKEGNEKETPENGTRNLINEVLKLLPENQKYHFENYPFENSKTFKTNIRKKYVGGIKNNKPMNVEEEEILDMRYPTLQCVAHSLPKDVKYRDNVIHAIKVLERSKYWDHESKKKAISSLIEVWNNMCSSEHYEKVLDKALPVIYTKDMLKKTKTRRDTYNRGLKYIQSLTTQKPLSARLKK